MIMNSKTLALLVGFLVGFGIQSSIPGQTQETPLWYRLNQEAVKLSDQGQFGEAYEKALQAYQLQSENQVLRENLIQIGRAYAGKLAENSKWEKAIDLLQALRDYPEAPDDLLLRQLTITYNNYGVALSDKEEYIDADRALNRACQLAYQLGENDFYSQIAGVYSRMLTAWGQQWMVSGKGETAKIKLLEAMRYDDRNASAAQLLSKIYFDDGDYRQAEYYLKLAQQIRPQDAEIRQQLERIQTESELDGDLRSRKRGNFRVEFSGSEELDLAGEVFEILGKARKDIGRFLDFYPDETLLVKIYNAQHSNALGIAPHWASGLYDGKIRVMAADIRRGGGDLEDILYHEYTHAVLVYLTRHNIPTWLNEGLAQYVEPNDRITSQQERAVRRWIEQGQYVSMGQLEDTFLNFDSERAQQAYLESRIFVSFIVDRFGEYKLCRFLKKLSEGLEVDKAAKAVYNRTITDLEIQWVKEIQ